MVFLALQYAIKSVIIIFNFINTVIIQFKWDKTTPRKIFLLMIFHWYEKFQMAPSSKKTTAAFTLSRNILSPTSKHINRPSLISPKNYQKSTSIFSISKEQIQNFKILFARHSSRFHSCIST